MEFNYIIYTVEDGIATIQLNRPKALNALNGEISSEIMAAIQMVKANPEVRVLIMTGSYRAYAAGADVKEMATATPLFAKNNCGLAIDINNELENLPIPVIAAVAGFAFGGGCEMVVSCDFRVGGSRTLLSFPEVGLGIIPGANGCARAVALVGAAKAKQLIMLTPKVPGKEAYEMGLLDWYVDSPELQALNAKAAEAKAAMKAAAPEQAADAKAAYQAAETEAAQAEYAAIRAKALSIANELKAKPACALAAAKACIVTAANETINLSKRTETANYVLLFNTHDQREGMAAMIEKRPPNFTHN